jgi:heme exporter protein D
VTRILRTKGKTQVSVICHLTFLILSLALLWPVAQHPGWWIWTPGAAHSDLAVTHWPNAHFTRRALWDEGQFPLWRPTIMSGAPFAANPLAGLYYPPNWLFLFLPWLPLEVGFNLSALAHLWLAGAAMYALMRRGLCAGVWGALVAAVAYEASPKLLAHLGAGHVGWVQAWGWLPVVVVCWLEAFRTAEGRRARSGEQEAGSRKREARREGRFVIRSLEFATLAGVALAVQFFADVRMAAYTLIACGWLLVARCWKLDAGRRGSRTRRQKARPWALGLGLWALGLVIFFGLAAGQWLPLAALLPETTRASMTLHGAAVWSLPGRYLAGLLLADHGGFHEWMTYVGVSTLVLAGLGVQALRHRRGERWLVGWLMGLLVGAVWFSLGENGGLFQVLWRIVPGLGLLRVPPRAWVLVVFATAVLAGLGVDQTRGQGKGKGKGWTGSLKRWPRVWLLAVGAFPAMLVAGYWLLVGMPPLNLAMFGLVTPLTVVLVGLGSGASKPCVNVNLKPETLTPETLTPETPEPEIIFGLAAVLLVAVDLFVVDVTLVEARPPEEIFADGREAAEWLAAQPGRFRVHSPSYSVPQHVAERYGLELADGVDPLQLRVYADYLTRAAGLEPQGYSVTLPPFPEGADVRTALQDVVPDVEMLGLLGVRYVAAAFPIADGKLHLVGQFDGVYVYRNEGAEPLAGTASGGDIVLSDGRTLFRYRPWPAYAGWAASGVTVIALLAAWLVSWSRRRRIDG